MIQDHSSYTPIMTDLLARSDQANRRARFLSILRLLSFGVGFALFLTCLEGVFWTRHLFRAGPSTTSAFLALPIHAPLFLLVPLAEIVAGFWLAWLVAQPLARLAYFKALGQAQEEYRELHTPLQTWSYPYEVPITYYQNDPDPTHARQARSLSVLDLVEEVLKPDSSHLLLLGATGSGKTMFLHEYLSMISQRRHALIFKRHRVPVFFPLKYYALLLQQQGGVESSTISLLDLLFLSDLPGLNRLRPYLGKLFRQGRLLFLCDGLDEISDDTRALLQRKIEPLLRENRNTLILTCTEKVYRQSPELTRLIGENLIPRAELQPLEQIYQRPIVERFITELDASYRPKLPTAGQIMHMIEQTRLHSFCTTPFYLFALMESIGTQNIEGLQTLDTRGRLLHQFLQVLENRVYAKESPGDVLLFLGEIACLACWGGNTDVLCLTTEATTTGIYAAVPERKSRAFLDWASDQYVYFPFAENHGELLASTMARERLASLVSDAQKMSLLDLTSEGFAHFRHPLIASALLAEYLGNFLGTSSLQIEMIETFPVDLAPWSEALTLWAGRVEHPLEMANALAQIASTVEENAQRASALLLCLICLGVAQIPPGSAGESRMVIPPVLESVLSNELSNPSELDDLAILFTRCADQSSPELYQSLFPLLALPGIEALLTRLDATYISELFFQRLIEVIDEFQQESMVKRLVRALSCLGITVVPRAAYLCSAKSTSGGRLRTAAINILGGTRERDAVEPLMTCLYDTDKVIIGRAANALARLGPDLTLQRLVKELETYTPTAGKKSLHWVILPILERFLKESDPARRLKPVQYQRIVDALMHIMVTHTNHEDLTKIRAILVSQGRMAEESESGKMAVSMFIQNLSTSNDTVARSITGTLKEVGEVATPHLLEQLEKQTSEKERVRILEILASVRDMRALPVMLNQLTDNSVLVQQALASALYAYSPECIPNLINAILHNKSELLASRAEQILSQLGESIVKPGIQALNPVVPDRTLMLIHALEQTNDPRIVPALIPLLQLSLADASLTLAIVQALGQSRDRRAVLPLLDILNNPNSLLSEGALNALSSLGELASTELLVRLDTPEKTPQVARIERIFLGMQPFPGERLLQAVDEGSLDQARSIEKIFLARGADAAQVLAINLFHIRPGVRDYVRQLMNMMDERNAVPALLEVLGKPEPMWQTLVANYLLKHLQVAIPPLVGLLDDPERGEAAASILIQAGRPVLSELVPALASSASLVQERTSHILTTLVQQNPDWLLDTVQLFGMTLPPLAHETLEHLLTEEMADLSLPALLAGLEDAHLVRDVSGVLVRLIRHHPARSAEVSGELLAALRVKSRRYGASLALIDLGAMAVPGVGALIADPDVEVARSARHVISEIGTPALPFLWAAHSDTSDPDKREAARDIFRTMPTMVIKNELTTLLSSSRQEDISMALALLLERIHDESLSPAHTEEMVPALLEYIQSTSDERTSLRLLALLILLGGKVVTPALVNALYNNPQGHERLTQAFLLLGQGVESDLMIVLQDPDAPVSLQSEIAGILAMRTGHSDLEAQALSLSEYGLWAGRTSNSTTTVLQAPQLEISLRSLGGLLVGGHWNANTLQERRSRSKIGSSEREVYDILLGWRYSPQITRMEGELESEREERKQELFAHTQELLLMKAQIIDLEQDLENLKREHEELHVNHKKEKEDLQAKNTLMGQEKQSLQNELRKVSQEKQVLVTNAQKVSQEKEHLTAEAKRWQTYSQQIEQELVTLRRPKSNA